MVDGGNVLVGWPGAPGWTTTGLGSASCAATDTDTKHTKMLARAATTIKRRGLIDFRSAVWMASPYTNRSSLCNLCGHSVLTEKWPSVDYILRWTTGCTDLVIRSLKLWTIRVAVHIFVTVAVHVAVAAVGIAFGSRIERLCHLLMLF